MSKIPDRIIIPVYEMEFVNEGNTIWIHSPDGGSVLRIKCSGKIIPDVCKNSPISHGDILVDGDIHICVALEQLKH